MVEKSGTMTSDAMIDYFDIAYYVHINVGKWNKQYEIVEAA